MSRRGSEAESRSIQAQHMRAAVGTGQEDGDCAPIWVPRTPTPPPVTRFAWPPWLSLRQRDAQAVHCEQPSVGKQGAMRPASSWASAVLAGERPRCWADQMREKTCPAGVVARAPE